MEPARSNSTLTLLIVSTTVVVGHFFAVVWHLVLLVKVQPATPRLVPPLLILINLLPVAGLVAFAKGFFRAAAAMIILPLGVALVVGVYAHFLSPGTDNVLRMAPGEWTRSFQVSAVLLVALEAAGCGVGILMARSRRNRGHSPAPLRHPSAYDAMKPSI